MRRILKWLAIRLTVLPGVKEAGYRAAYLGRFHQWLRDHPCPEVLDRPALYDLVVRTGLASERFTFLEFGVYRGGTIRWWVDHTEHPKCRFVGFDSFEGLPEQWGSRSPGTFTTRGMLPEIEDQRVTFVKGWFSDTVAKYIAASPPTGRLVVHLDADLYSSTLVALMAVAPFLKAGDILLFDEWADYDDEFRAFEACVAAYRLEYTALGRTPTNQQMALRITAPDRADETYAARDESLGHHEQTSLP